MPSCANATTASSSANQGSDNGITAIHPDIVQTHILKKLDAVTLASASCVSSRLRSLCSDDRLWRDLCNSTWPSTTDPRVVRAISAFPSAHRSFYSDSFLSTHPRLPKKTRLPATSELISAVDIYYDDQVIYSKVLETRTVENRFRSSPLSLRLLDLTEVIPTQLEFDDDPTIHLSLANKLAKEHLKVSWIVIDPNNKRAVNIASHKAIDPIRWWTSYDTIQLCYPTVAAVAPRKLAQFSVVVTCSRPERRRELHVKQVEMHIEDIEGKTLTGRESVEILQAAMDGWKRRIDGMTEEYNYRTFLRNQQLYREEQRFYPFNYFRPIL